MFNDLLKAGYISVFYFAAIDGDFNQHTGGLGQRIPSLRVFNKNTFEPNFNTVSGYKSIVIEQDFWMSILLDVGIGLEIKVFTSKFILLGDQMLGEMRCHPEICFYTKHPSCHGQHTL